MNGPSSPLKEALSRHLSNVTRLRDPFENPEGYAYVKNYLLETLTKSRIAVEESRFDYQGKRFGNLIAAFGPEKAFPQVVVGAHFDAVPGTPGADDNASGVAALIETALELAKNPSRTSIHLVFFTLEEQGMIGSSFYAAELKQRITEQGLEKDFIGMLSLEMVGYVSRVKDSQQMPALLRPFYPDTGDFLALVGDQDSGDLLAKAQKAFHAPGFRVETLSVPMKGKLFPEVRLSDHSPFWDAGLPALLVTDTSFFRNPHYHLPSDALETLDLDFLAGTTEGLIRFLQKFC